MRNAQVSLEYLLGSILVLGFVAVFLGYALKVLWAQSAIAQTNSAASEIQRAVHELSQLGPGSKKTVTVSLPGGVSQALIGDKSAGWRLGEGSEALDIVYPLDQNIYGTLPATAGEHSIGLLLNDSNIQIT